MTTFELTKEYVEKIEAAIEQKDEKMLMAEMEELYPADIASILLELDGEPAHYLITLVDTETGAEILSYIEPEDRKRFIKERFTVEEIAKYVNLFDSDDAVDLLNEQTIEVREKVIALIEDREQARFIIDLLHYPEDVAGGLMQKELIKVNTNWTVSECVEEIRRQAEDVEKVYAVYVVDDDQKLKGIVSLKRIILARKNTKIENIVDEEIVYVETTRPAEEVAEIMQRYDLEAIPVVNTLGRLLGRITIDDVVDFITDKAEEDIQVMAGITGEAEEDDSVWDLAKARLPWLIVGVIGSLLAATVIGRFEDEFKKVAALAAFIPIMGSTGGNVGIQTSSLIVQSLAEKSGITTSLGQRLFKIILVALVNGIIIGSMAGLYVYLSGETQLFFVVCISLLSVVVLASFTGTVTPLLLDKLGINPAIASGPFITTANDIIGIGTYLMIANLLLHL
ncbi:magnesium transporter [Emticicia oligotrophica DSM 17448]|uniref:Magnesium transporter MgtE n=1 Tax=Emticicia oligotrophica (strain DSM 17448 / CIP 109782 / MTCC 6937 / GPTSA100-15) TaxID=929562 RepID=A0ABM5MY35_EMTOG|nr:magnesium transporter [Emticicia oligotrophica]AFK02019.1 magnesium transporter [Emticicia oligotrophica DSM 17448]